MPQHPSRGSAERLESIVRLSYCLYWNPVVNVHCYAAKVTLLLCCICTVASVGCERHKTVQLKFAPVDEGGALHCSNTVAAKIFIYEVMLRSTNGSWVPTHPMSTDGTNIHLIETGCHPSPRTAHIEAIPEADGPFNGLRFTIGVPPFLNHDDPTLATPPLNRADMFWVWQQGYKFMSIETRSAVFHLGSTGCESPAPVRPPVAPCAQPNRLTVTLEEFDPARDIVGLALTKLLAPLAEDQRCTGNYQATHSCRQLLGSLELDLVTGRCGAGCAQRLLLRARR